MVKLTLAYRPPAYLAILTCRCFDRVPFDAPTQGDFWTKLPSTHPLKMVHRVLVL